MRTIDREELRSMLDDARDVRVVSTLGPRRYRAAHIPGSETFVDHREALATLCPDEPLVLHGSNEADFTHQWAYHLFVTNGFRDVRCYTGGLDDWSTAGLPLEGTGRLQKA